MKFGLQDVLVALAAAGALGWLIRRRLRRGGAAPCDSCPAAERGHATSDFVALEDVTGEPHSRGGGPIR